MRGTERSIFDAQTIRFALCAAIPPRVGEAATSAETIGCKMAIFEGAFHEAASGKGASPELTTLEPNAHERSDIGQRQVQVTLAKCAVKENRGDVQTLSPDAPELAELKKMLLPKDILWKVPFKDVARKSAFGMLSLKLLLPRTGRRQACPLLAGNSASLQPNNASSLSISRLSCSIGDLT